MATVHNTFVLPHSASTEPGRSVNERVNLIGRCSSGCRLSLRARGLLLIEGVDLQRYLTARIEARVSLSS